jgi:hypothetical protein
MGPLFLQGRDIESPMWDILLQIENYKGNGEEIQAYSLKK